MRKTLAKQFNSAKFANSPSTRTCANQSVCTVTCHHQVDIKSSAMDTHFPERANWCVDSAASLSGGTRQITEHHSTQLHGFGLVGIRAHGHVQNEPGSRYAGQCQCKRQFQRRYLTSKRSFEHEDGIFTAIYSSLNRW